MEEGLTYDFPKKFLQKETNRNYLLTIIIRILKIQGNFAQLKILEGWTISKEISIYTVYHYKSSQE